MQLAHKAGNLTKKTARFPTAKVAPTKPIAALRSSVVVGIFVLCLGGCTTPSSSDLAHVKSISVRGVTVAVGDPAEEILKTFTPADECAERFRKRETSLDPAREDPEYKRPLDNMTGVHYVIQNRWYEIDYGILDDSGSYKVKDIVFFGGNNTCSITAATEERTTSATISPPISTLAEFDASPFCRSAKCRLFERWMLQDGTTNSVYHLFVRAEAKVEVQTSRPQSVVSIAMSFYDVDRLKPSDLSLVDLLICSIDKDGDCSSTRQFVRDHVERSVFQISEVKPFPLHGLLIRAGEVGRQQIVMVIGRKH